MRRVHTSIAVATAVAWTSIVWAQAPRSPTPGPVAAPFTASVVAQGLEHPWALVLLPDDRILVTERPGRMRFVTGDGQLSTPLKGLPEVFTRGQGGLLDVTLSPKFAEDGLVYFSFSEPGQGGAGTAVARARLGNEALQNVEVIWRQKPKVHGPNHWGSRIVFDKDGALFVTLGDRFSHRDKVQPLNTTIGKTVRINADGSAPEDNPFFNRKEALPEIWSIGHRSVQAATLHPQTGELWTVEHGARGGDELNNPQAGKNYGWPVITYGVDYSGVKIGEGTAKTGMEQPIYYWDPVIAPSGAVFYSGKAFPDWDGDLLIGSLKLGGLVRLEMQDGKVTREMRYAEGETSARIRDVQVDEQGVIYVVTDEEKGKVLRLAPKASS